MLHTASPFPPLETRLPGVGDNIFSAMSALAAQHQTINLGQGFPDFACDAALADAIFMCAFSSLQI